MRYLNMSNDYLDTKVKEALSQSGGRASKAAKLLIEWSIEDHPLLLSLAHKQLPAMALHAIEKEVGVPSARKKTAAKPKPIDIPPESFGKDLLQALSGKDAVRFGMEGAIGRPIESKRKKASQQHIDTLKKMSAYKPDETTKTR